MTAFGFLNNPYKPPCSANVVGKAENFKPQAADIH
jgi:hypothetical protein